MRRNFYEPDHDAYREIVRTFAEREVVPNLCRDGPCDGPEMFPHQRVALVNGRSLTWYGPSLITARPGLPRS
jgi:hypothetical protein